MVAILVVVGILAVLVSIAVSPRSSRPSGGVHVVVIDTGEASSTTGAPEAVEPMASSSSFEWGTDEDSMVESSSDDD